MSNESKQTTINTVKVTKSAMDDDYRVALRTYLEKFILIPTKLISDGKQKVETAKV